MSNENVDILTYDTEILDNFNKEIDNLDYYKNKIIELNTTLNTYDKLSYRVRQNIKEEINLINNKIEDITQQKSKNFYIMETINILNDYKQELRAPVTMNFMGKKQQNSEKKNEIIKKYINIAKKYHDNIYLSSPESNNNIVSSKLENCANCKSNNYDMTDNSYICRD